MKKMKQFVVYQGYFAKQKFNKYLHHRAHACVFKLTKRQQLQLQPTRNQLTVVFSIVMT